MRNYCFLRWGNNTCLVNTEWFKINLTLFKSHISHKWEDIMNLFEDIFTKCNTLGRFGENGIKIDVEIMKWGPFSGKWSKTILHAHKVYGALLETVPWYKLAQCQIDIIKVSVHQSVLHRSMVRALKL